MATKLFVGKLSFDTTDATLLELFKPYGEVISADVIIDKISNRSRGFGFVEMADLKAAQKAIEELNDKEFEGRTIVVSTANPPRQQGDDSRRDAGYRRSW
jgi:RNA recognition motif-containing protein